MSVPAVLAVHVTVHQVIFLLMCKIASASMTTFSTHCISVRIKAFGGCWQSYCALQNVLMRNYEKEIKYLKKEKKKG